MTVSPSWKEPTCRMPTARTFAIRYISILGVLALIGVSLSACGGKKPTPSSPPRPIDFNQALQYAQRAALAYEQDGTIQKQSGTARSEEHTSELQSLRHIVC